MYFDSYAPGTIIKLQKGYYMVGYEEECGSRIISVWWRRKRENLGENAKVFTSGSQGVPYKRDPKACHAVRRGLDEPKSFQTSRNDDVGGFQSNIVVEHESA